MRDLNMPHASALPRGATILWTNPTERTGLRWGLVAIVAVSALAGVTAGYFVGVKRGRKKNPRRRRKKR